MDDLITINDSTTSMTENHEIIMNWYAKWEATINPTKLEILQNNMTKEAASFAKHQKIHIGKTIKEILKYLGVTLNKHIGGPKGWDDHAKVRGQTGQKMMGAFYLAGRRGMKWRTASANSNIHCSAK